MIFPSRDPQPEEGVGRRETELYAAYLERSAPYREELLRRLVELAGDGLVLEVGDGCGPAARALLRRAGVRLCRALRTPWGVRVQLPEPAGERARWVAAVLGEEGRLPFPDGSFQVVFAEGRLRRWGRPRHALAELLRVTREEGTLLLHDLRRDADPFVTEFLVRELAEDDSADGRFLLRHFLASLRAAYAADEVARLLCEAGHRTFLLDGTDEMSLTVVVRKDTFPTN